MFCLSFSLICVTVRSPHSFFGLLLARGFTEQFSRSFCCRPTFRANLKSSLFFFFFLFFWLSHRWFQVHSYRFLRFCSLSVARNKTVGAAAAHVLMNFGHNDRANLSTSITRKRPMQHSGSVPEDLTTRRVGDMTINSPTDDSVQLTGSRSKRVRPSLVQDSDTPSHSLPHATAIISNNAMIPGASAPNLSATFSSNQPQMPANPVFACDTSNSATVPPDVSSTMVDIPPANGYSNENSISSNPARISLGRGMLRVGSDTPIAMQFDSSYNPIVLPYRQSSADDNAAMTPTVQGSSIQDDSDSDSSSCKDVEDPGVLAPDSVPAMVAEIRKLLDYIASKPTLQCGSASFIRDYLRTMLIQNAAAAEEAIANAAKAAKEANCAGGFGSDMVSGSGSSSFFRTLPDELAKHIFSFLDGKNLAIAREVHPKWNEFACEEHLWRSLCLKRWHSLETDQELWKLIDKNVTVDTPNRWRKIYPTINKHAQWLCRLQKTGRFICNLVAHQISGAALGPNGLPKILVVERRFNILHLQTFVLPDASVLYFEPEQESDRAGFKDFIEYLTKRTRAGLALEDQRRFIFIPPCDYTRTHVGYAGMSLLGVVQNAYPPLAP